jgi:AcrR family transcriptional regulator
MTPPAPAREPADEPVRRRRSRGEPRRLLIEAARDLFNRKGFASTSTREIADQSGVSETLIYRNFKTKAGLFREAMVQPFVDALDAEISRNEARPITEETALEATTAFVSSMYDLFREHRALAAMVFAADALVESEVAETGMIDDVRDALDRFVRAARDQARGVGVDISPAAHDLAIRGHLAMVAGIATFGPWYLGRRRPSRRAIVDELTRWVLLRYGYELQTERLSSSCGCRGSSDR